MYFNSIKFFKIYTWVFKNKSTYLWGEKTRDNNMKKGNKNYVSRSQKKEKSQLNVTSQKWQTVVKFGRKGNTSRMSE